MLKQVVHTEALGLKGAKKNVNFCFLMPNSSIKMLFTVNTPRTLVQTATSV
jgi:hypothetical protein